VEVPAVAGALVVNVGDLLQLVSNDRFKSVEHRVVASSVGPRVSVACFFRTNGAAAAASVLAPIVTDGDGKVRYRSTTVEELLRHSRAKGLDGTSALQHFRI
jgi:isopenicillin N synthase-like dioxygenase